MAFCPKCGNKVNDGDQFCAKCGNGLELFTEQISTNNRTALKSTAKYTKLSLIVSISILLICTAIASAVFIYIRSKKAFLMIPPQLNKHQNQLFYLSAMISLASCIVQEVLSQPSKMVCLLLTIM